MTYQYTTIRKSEFDELANIRNHHSQEKKTILTPRKWLDLFEELSSEQRKHIIGQIYTQTSENAERFRKIENSLIRRIFGEKPVRGTDEYDVKGINTLNEVLATLTPREEKTVKLRYGFTDGRMLTQEKVGKLMDLSQPQISRILTKALRKLRHPSRSRRLKAFLEGKQ